MKNNISTNLLKNIIHQYLPTVILAGKTGAGKSFIGNKISNSSKFKENDSLTSETDDFNSLECSLNESLKIKIWDTVGYSDNRGIDPNKLYKLSKFYQNINSGVNVVLLVVNLADNRLDVDTFEKVIQQFNSDKIIPNLVIILNPPAYLPNVVVQKRLQNYITDTKDILNNNNIKLVDENIILYESDLKLREFLINYINERNPYVPQNSENVVKAKKNNINNIIDDDSEDDRDALLTAAENNQNLANEIKGEINVNNNLRNNAERARKINPGNKNAKKIIKDHDKFTYGKAIGVNSVKIVSEVVGKKLLVKGVEKVGAQLAGQGVKNGVAITGKAVPIVGVAIGISFGLFRIFTEKGFKRKFGKAFAEIAAGFASIIPGVGTGASLGISGGLIAWDIADVVADNKTEVKKNN